MDRPQQLNAVTSLRFLAAFYVFLFHIHISWPLAEPGTSLDQFLTNGAVGMSLFFTLSGFVLAYSNHFKVIELKKFYLRRFTRIYPVYVLAGLVTLPWLFGAMGETQGVSTPGAWQIAFIIFSAALLFQAWMPQLFAYWNNSGSWSISTEAFFYAIFPFTHRLLNGQEAKNLVIAAAAIFTIMSAVSASLWSFPNPHSFLIFYSVPIYRVAEFLLGSIAGIVFARGIVMPAAGVTLVLAIVAIATLLTVGPNLAWHYTAYNPVTVPLIVLMLVSAASLRSGVSNALFTLRPVVYLGDISYSFYSFQALALFVTAEFLPRSQPYSAMHWVLAVIVFVPLTIVAAISHHFVETRFRRYLDRGIDAKQPTMSAAATN